MTNLKSLVAAIPSFAKDTKINIENLISEENSALSYKQILGTALAAAYATEEKTAMIALRNEAKTIMSQEEIDAVKSAAVLMAMNNTYYRFVHISSDKDYGKMAAGLRMQGIKNHGIEKIDFEIYSLAISVINGCGMCIDAHSNTLIQEGITKEQIQMIAKIAATIASAARAITIDEIVE